MGWRSSLSRKIPATTPRLRRRRPRWGWTRMPTPCGRLPTPRRRCPARVSSAIKSHRPAVDEPRRRREKAPRRPVLPTPAVVPLPLGQPGRTGSRSTSGLPPRTTTSGSSRRAGPRRSRLRPPPSNTTTTTNSPLRPRPPVLPARTVPTISSPLKGAFCFENLFPPTLRFFPLLCCSSLRYSPQNSNATQYKKVHCEARTHHGIITSTRHLLILKATNSC
uniref:(northern house mosquito) hypothetical protein n=1 Tax=Culex pipiens TaxID=7175 RepID=A0A8D8BW32_CULPI